MNCVSCIEYLQCSKRLFSGCIRNFKMVSLSTKMVSIIPCQPKTIVANAYSAVVDGLIKQDAILILTNSAYSVGML